MSNEIASILAETRAASIEELEHIAGSFQRRPIGRHTELEKIRVRYAKSELLRRESLAVAAGGPIPRVIDAVTGEPVLVYGGSL